MRLTPLAAVAALALLAAAPAGAAPPARPAVIHGFDGRSVRPETIDAEARRLMAAAHVNGLAMAVIDDGRVVYVNSWGHRNVEKGLPLQRDTVMYGASITKFVFGYLVMQLVEEGKVDLDKPIRDYLPRPLWEYDDGYYASLKDDPRWEKLTLRMLLTHSAGFNNFAFMEPDEKIHIHFEPGSRYSYSGDGIILAQRVLEWGLGIDVEAEMQRRIWDRFGMTRTSLRWRPEWNANLADGYALDGSFEPHDERSNVRAAGSMDTTIEDLARFYAGFMRGEGLEPATRTEMLRPQLPIRSPAQFPTLSEAVAPQLAPYQLSAALSVVTFRSKDGLAFFKGGHNEWTGNITICVMKTKRCVIYLSNDVRAESLFQRLTEATVGDPGMPWSWENYIPYDQPQLPAH
jgi:CubicO group peptidase (beta-lactamase class C family)